MISSLQPTCLGPMTLFAENIYQNKRLCLMFSGAHRQYVNKIILMRKGIDIICVVSGLKVLGYTDFSRIYKINADV